MNKANIKLEYSLKECDKHLLRLNSAHKKMKQFMPLTATSYKKLTDDEIEHIDQYLFRFAKLQDALGERLFKNLLAFLGEITENKSFIDIFNKLEQLNIVDDYDGWLELRTIRNELAHEYDDEAAENAIRINKIYEIKDKLTSYFTHVKIYLNKREFY